VLALQAAVQPLLKDFGFAAIGLYAETGAPADKAWLVLRAAAESAPAETWLETLVEALDLAAGSDTLEYRDARRGLLKRVGWRTETDGSHIDGLLLTDAQRNPNSESLLDTALSGRVWSGSRLAVFAHSGSGGARDAVVCNCMQVRESQIRAQVTQGAGVAELKQRLGCGTVCGSCLPQLAQLCRQPQRA
jgi:assimilatory nitrate reductase catalytic subunit